MTIYNVYIINRAGSLMYHYDNNLPKIETEQTFSYPLQNFSLRIVNEKVVVSFGQEDGIRIGHTVLAINGIQMAGSGGMPGGGPKLEDGRDIMSVIENEANYPLSIKFGRPKHSANERLMLAGTFHSLFSIAAQLSPMPQSSGIQVLETDVFKLHCSQTQTGVKFIVVTDLKQSGQDAFLKKMHELYADYALKNPNHIIDMPIRNDLFDINLQQAIDFAEKMSLSN